MVSRITCSSRTKVSPKSPYIQEYTKCIVKIHGDIPVGYGLEKKGPQYQIAPFSFVSPFQL